MARRNRPCRPWNWSSISETASRLTTKMQHEDDVVVVDVAENDDE